MTRIPHFFTVDVEEYFQVSALEPYVSRNTWDTMQSRVEVSVDQLLDLLARHETKATFFTLGWIAERHSQMVKRIADLGHEVASHGWDHKRVTELQPEEFRDSVRRSKDTLEALVGTSVLGFRAPSFSIVTGREWALDILLEEGYEYDSSLFPITRKGYGYSGGKRFPHKLELGNGELYELPPTTLQRFGKNLPAAGGGYFRLLPYKLTHLALSNAERSGHRGMFYIHPWEIDPDQPRFNVSLATRTRHYGGLKRNFRRLERLFLDFEFTSVADALEADGWPASDD